MVRSFPARRSPLMAGRFVLLLLAALVLADPSMALAQDGAPVSGGAPEEPEYESVDVLRARMRPMPREAAEAELARWFDILIERCQAVSEAEVATLESEDDEAIDDLSARAGSLRAHRGSVLDRVDAAASMVERKGGDVADVRAYMESVTDIPPVTGLKAAWGTARGWLASPEGGVSLLKALASAAAVLLLAWLVSLLVARITTRLLSRSPRISVLLRTFATLAARRTVLALGVLMALSRLGVNMTPLLAAIGAAGLVVGLALQGTLSNFASGLMIMVYRPFDVGDFIVAAGTLGTVEGMTLVTTSVCTLDNELVSIPNNSLWGDVITNRTAKETRRVDLVFGISYGDDMARAAEVLMDVISSHEKVLGQPEPFVHVASLGDSSVNFNARPWVKTGDYWDVYWDLTRDVKVRFDAEGISIPFPQRDVHLFPQAAPDEERQPAHAPTAASPEAGT